MRRALVILVAPVLLSGHDLVVLVEPGESAVVLRASYDGLESAGWADVEIFAPGEASDPYQTGATDSSGAFAFVPSASGEWMAVVDDGYGHRTETRIRWEESAPPPVQEPQAKPFLWRNALTGVSLLIGLTGIWLWRQSRSGAAARQP